MTVYMTNLHETNLRNAYVEQIKTLADVLRVEGLWDWNLQRRLDSDVQDLRATRELDLTGDDLVRDWEDRVRKEGVDIDTEIYDGTYIVTVKPAAVDDMTEMQFHAG